MDAYAAEMHMLKAPVVKSGSAMPATLSAARSA